MAKVLIENSRDHDLVLSRMDKDNGIVSVTIPGARQDPSDRNQVIKGLAEVEQEHIDLCTKASPVVKHYFEEGWLGKATKKTIDNQAKLEA